MEPWVWLVIGGIVVIIVIVVGLVVSSSGERALLEERLGKYADDEKKDDSSAQGGSALGDWVNKRVEKTSMGDNIAKKLAQADMKFKPGEYVALIVITTIAVGAILWFVGGQHWVSFGIGALVGFAAPQIYVNTQQGARLQKFNDQLPDMINLMVNGLRAGYSTMQAMEAVSRELPPPISEEFRRVVQEMQLGVPMERALDNLLRRIPSEDLDFLVTAVNVQREVGGPLAEILDTISFTIRERIKIKGDIRVMTSQVVMSGRILSGVPFAIVVIIWFVNRAYMMEFLNNLVCGGIAAGVGLVMIGVGYFIMTKIADIEV
jgi:tight adherence protein B